MRCGETGAVLQPNPARQLALLAELPFAELVTYPECFRLDRCEVGHGMTALRTKYTGGE